MEAPILSPLFAPTYRLGRAGTLLAESRSRLLAKEDVMSQLHRIHAVSFAAIAILTVGCYTGSDEMDEPISDNHTSFEEWKSSLPRDPFSGAYIVEGDIPIYDEEELETYFVENEPGALAVQTVNGADDRWSGVQAMNLTYCVSTSFGQNHAAVVNAMNAAGSSWAAEAAVRFVYVSAQDLVCDANNANVVFNVRPVSGTNYNAMAFFPSYARAQRELLINWANATNAAPKTLTGILRHELGHALGFRHEHTRVQGSCFEDWNWRALTDYDPGSVMHYRQCPNGNWNFGDYTLTQLDKNGVKALYGAERRLVAKHSNKCVDVAAYNTLNGTPLFQWSCSGGDNQDFALVDAGGGYYNLVAEHSGKCIDVEANSTLNGAPLLQWSCSGGDNQKFSLVDAGGGYYNLVAKHSSKCIDVAAYSTLDGATLLQWSCSGSDNQKFSIVP
jgi:hypothetical protein